MRAPALPGEATDGVRPGRGARSEASTAQGRGVWREGATGYGTIQADAGITEGPVSPDSLTT